MLGIRRFFALAALGISVAAAQDVVYVMDLTIFTALVSRISRWSLEGNERTRNGVDYHEVGRGMTDISSPRPLARRPLSSTTCSRRRTTTAQRRSKTCSRACARRTTTAPRFPGPYHRPSATAAGRPRPRTRRAPLPSLTRTVARAATRNSPSRSPTPPSRNSSPMCPGSGTSRPAPPAGFRILSSKST